MLTHELLDVVWNQYPASQHGMLGWLNHLASHQQAVVRQRAALAAAVFAEFDFEQVVANLLGDWAGSYKARVRQAAGIGLAQAARNPRLTRTVTRKVHEWARGDWFLLQETAARAYAVGLTALVPVRSVLNDLHAIGQNEKALASPAVADALEALSAPSTIGAIATALVEWQKSGHECLVAHAARGIVALARQNSDDTPAAWPLLLAWAEKDPKGPHILASMLGHSIRGPHTCGAICETVHRWIVTAEYDGPMAEVLLAVLTQVSTDMEARRRLRYHFARQWRSGAHVGPVARRVTALVEGEE